MFVCAAPSCLVYIVYMLNAGGSITCAVSRVNKYETPNRHYLASGEPRKSFLRILANFDHCLDKIDR